MLNENKFRSIYDDYLESGLTIRDYCSNQRMGEANFYYWKHRLKGLLPPKRGFVPIVFEKDQFVRPTLWKVLHNLGRKNWLFCGNDNAAENAAIMYSMFGCCKASDVNFREWLIFFLDNVHKYDEDYSKDLAELLPQNFKVQGQN